MLLFPSFFHLWLYFFYFLIAHWLFCPQYLDTDLSSWHKITLMKKMKQQLQQQKQQMEYCQMYWAFFNSYFCWFFYFNGCLQSLPAVHVLVLSCFWFCLLVPSLSDLRVRSFNTGIHLGAVVLLLTCCSSLFRRQPGTCSWFEFSPLFFFLLSVNL